MADHVASAITLYLVKNESSFIWVLTAPFLGGICVFIINFLLSKFKKEKLQSKIIYEKNARDIDVNAYVSINKKVADYILKLGHISLVCEESEKTGSYYDNELGKWCYRGSYAIHSLHPSDDEYSIPYGKYVVRAKRYNIALEKNISEYIQIMSDDGIKVLKEFEQEAMDEYLAWYREMQKNDPDEYKRFEWNKDNGWKKHKIPTIKTYDNVFLEGKTFYKLKESIQSFIDAEQDYMHYGMPYKKGFMFSGVPGCGKSSLVYAITHELKRNIYHTKLNTSDDIKSMKCIPPNSIIVVEDIDVYDVANERKDIVMPIKPRKKEDESEGGGSTIIHMNSSNLAELLEVMDGYCYLHGCIIIFTTNHPDRIDPALIRPGRIDEHYVFERMSLKTMNDIVKFYFGEEMKIDPEKDKKYTSSYFINSIILPNVKKPEEVQKWLISL